jgi:hypothetical protein
VADVFRLRKDHGMTINDEWEERRRNRWRRPNAHLYIRHDAWRFMPPGSPIYVGRDVVKYFEPEFQAVREALKRGEAPPAQLEPAAHKHDAVHVDMTPEELEAYRSELLEAKALVAELKWQLALRRFARKYRPDQPRVPAGNPDGGQWTSEGGAEGDADNGQFDNLSRLLPISHCVAICRNWKQLPTIRPSGPGIEEAWKTSNPHGFFPLEQGFWISRNETTGELYTRPFTGPSSRDFIIPGPVPNDAIASFHTHPNRPNFQYSAGPSRIDVISAGRTGLPGLIQSHHGMYYFGPALKPSKPR